MAIGTAKLEALRQYFYGVEPGGDYWIDPGAKFNLRKVSASDLVEHGVDEQRANKVVADLRRQDVSSLGEVLGVQFRMKFQIWVEREESAFCVKVDGARNADWLREYFASTVPSVQVSDASQDVNGRYYRFTVTCGDDSGPWRLEIGRASCRERV